MTALRDLLEVYGALDEAAAKSGNPSVSATLDEFHPGGLCERRVVPRGREFLFR